MIHGYDIRADHDLKIIRYRHRGVLDFDAIGEAWKELLSMQEFTGMKYNLLSDYSEALFDMELEEAERIVEFMRNIQPIVAGKRQSLVVSDPYSTAGSILFQKKVFEEVGFVVKTFSSLSAAEEWLVYGE